MKTEVPISKANRLINSGNLILVTSVAGGFNPNIITIAWHMPTSHLPMLVCISCANKHHSKRLISESGEFAVNIPTIDLLSEVVLCGTKSGRDIDKFKEAKFTQQPAQKIKPPLIKECIGHIECKVINTVPSGDHTIFIGEVIAAQAQQDIFDECWKVDDKKAKLIYHLGGKFFTHSSKRIEV